MWFVISAFWYSHACFAFERWKFVASMRFKLRNFSLTFANSSQALSHPFCSSNYNTYSDIAFRLTSPLILSPKINNFFFQRFQSFIQMIQILWAKCWFSLMESQWVLFVLQLVTDLKLKCQNQQIHWWKNCYTEIHVTDDIFQCDGHVMPSSERISYLVSVWRHKLKYYFSHSTRRAFGISK